MLAKLGHHVFSENRLQEPAGADVIRDLDSLYDVWFRRRVKRFGTGCFAHPS
ncbi:MAG: hypothetical protein WBP56_06760 [Polyangia bacterium]